jgi:hypothetical protein
MRLWLAALALLLGVSDAEAATNLVGPIQTYSCASHTWANALALGTGATTCVQPAFADVSGVDTAVAAAVNLSTLSTAYNTQTIFGAKPSLSGAGAAMLANQIALSTQTPCTVPGGTLTVNCGAFVPTAASAPTVGVALPAAAKLGLYGTTSELFSGATDVWDYGVTTAAVFTISGATSLPGIASSAAALDAVCWNATLGVLTHNAAGALCSASLEELKKSEGEISPAQALNEVMALKPIWARFKDSVKSTSDHKVHPMLGAHQVEGVDPRLSAYDGNGHLLSVEYMYLPALTIAAIKELKFENDELRREIAELNRRMR